MNQDRVKWVFIHMNDDKRQYRQMKRDIKKAGSRKARRQLQRDLEKNPEEAGFSEIDYGRNSSAPLNGNDHDATRKRSDDDDDE